MSPPEIAGVFVCCSFKVVLGVGQGTLFTSDSRVQEVVCVCACVCVGLQRLAAPVIERKIPLSVFLKHDAASVSVKCLFFCITSSTGAVY